MPSKTNKLLPRPAEFRRSQHPLKPCVSRASPPAAVCSCPECGSVITTSLGAQAHPDMARPEFFAVKFKCLACRKTWTERYVASAAIV